MKDYVVYMDTDSCYILMEKYIINSIKDRNKWHGMNDEEKIDFISKFGNLLSTELNKNIFKNTQVIDYNSNVEDFKIRFEIEAISKSVLFVKKKKYICHIVNDGGISTDKIKVIGLEVIRSDSSEAIRVKLNDIYEAIMKKVDDSELKEKIKRYVKELYDVTPDEIAANIGIRNSSKYIGRDGLKKHAPWHIKGVYNYKMLLKSLSIGNLYDDIHDGAKVRIAYTNPNRYGIDVIAFHQWPKEFNDVISINYEKMIEKFFIHKINLLLTPMNRKFVLIEEYNNDILDSFFG